MPSCWTNPATIAGFTITSLIGLKEKARPNRAFLWRSLFNDSLQPPACGRS